MIHTRQLWRPRGNRKRKKSQALCCLQNPRDRGIPKRIFASTSSQPSQHSTTNTCILDYPSLKCLLTIFSSPLQRSDNSIPAPIGTDFFLALSFSDLAAMSTQNSWKKEQELRLDNQCHEQGLAEADNCPLARRK